MDFQNVKYILTDIEGTTTSVSFVYDVLFPYFRENMNDLLEMENDPRVNFCFEEVKRLAKELEGHTLKSNQEVLDQLMKWSKADLKITPLKDLQGVIWEKGYESGKIKGHVYPEVKRQLMSWTERRIQCGVFSSGSVQAQKLIFGYSVDGDLTPFFSHYFDTNTGQKRELSTYQKIAENINVASDNILFLSDITAELETAENAGYQTCQLVRPGTIGAWRNEVSSFEEINIKA